MCVWRGIKPSLRRTGPLLLLFFLENTLFTK